VLVARGAAELEWARAEVAQLGPALAIAVDVAASDGPDRIVSGALARFGALHVLVNNAGRHARGPSPTRPTRTSAAMVDVNLRAPILLTRRALPHLLASGRGAVINIASLAGKCRPPAASCTRRPSSACAGSRWRSPTSYAAPASRSRPHSLQPVRPVSSSRTCHVIKSGVTPELIRTLRPVVAQLHSYPELRQDRERFCEVEAPRGRITGRPPFEETPGVA